MSSFATMLLFSKLVWNLSSIVIRQQPLSTPFTMWQKYREFPKQPKTRREVLKSKSICISVFYIWLFSAVHGWFEVSKYIR